VSTVFPSRDRWVARSLSVIVVEFWEPVTGVTAGDLTVNGAPATVVAVDRDGRRWRFGGFAIPPPGALVIELRSGQIVDREGLSFAGDVWNYRSFSPEADEDGDGLQNQEEIEALGSNPVKADTDDDGLPDGYEAAHPCLPVGINQALPHYDSHTYRSGADEEKLPGDPDTDDDGATDLEEFKRGSNPCAP